MPATTTRLPPGTGVNMSSEINAISTKNNQVSIDNDILFSILEELYHRKALATLASAASASTEWFHAAVPFLWKKVSLSTLLDFVLRDAGVSTNSEELSYDDHTKYVRLFTCPVGQVRLTRKALQELHRPLTQLEQQRLHTYAIHIRSLEVNLILGNLAVAELRKLKEAFSGIVEFEDFTTCAGPDSEMFMGTNLRRVQLVRSGSDEGNAILFTSMAVFCPALTDLQVHIWYLTERSQTALSSLLHQLDQLQRLELRLQGLREIKMDISTLALRPRLQSLRLGYELSPFVWEYHGHPGSFASLSSISISCRDPSGFLSFLQTLAQQSHLTEFEYESWPNGNEPANHLQDMLHVVGLHSQLRLVKVISKNGHANFEMFQPLMQCTLLQELAITVVQRLDMNDNDVGALVTPLPHLARLTLTYHTTYGAEGEVPKTTLKVFSIVGAACPSIEFILIDVDATQVPVDAPQALMRQQRDTSCTVMVARSPINDARGVADYLTRMACPHVTRVVCFQTSGEYGFKWLEVARLVDSVAKSRRQNEISA